MRFRSLAALSFLALTSLSALSQQAERSEVGGKNPINLSVVVTPGKNGKPVAGLPQSSFTVLDNGAPQPIQSFREVTGQAEPVKVLLVIDAVNVPFDRVAYARQQIDHLLRANDGQLPQPTALAIFTDTGTQIQPTFSKDGNALSQELDRQVIGLRDLRQSAGFFGAEERLDLSLKSLSQLVGRAQSQPGRKFIVWITPGWPLLTGPGVQLTSKEEQNVFNQVVGFSDALRRSNTTLYAVDPVGAAASPGRTFYYEQFLKGVKKPSQAVIGDLGIQVLAEQSGGRFLTGSNDVSALLAECFADASVQYQLSYAQPPSDASTEYHRIEIRMSDPHLVPRTRQGYYAHP